LLVLVVILGLKVAWSDVGHFLEGLVGNVFGAMEYAFQGQVRRHGG
jgi:hypothetical protein